MLPPGVGVLQSMLMRELPLLLPGNGNRLSAPKKVLSSNANDASVHVEPVIQFDV